MTTIDRPAALNGSSQTVLQVLGLVLLALAATGVSLINGFAYDDIPLILENARVQAGSPLWTYLGQDYWPARSDLLYRPITVWLFGVQWAIGGGSPWVFHAVSVTIYAGTVVGVFFLGRRLLPLWAAWLAAAIFAVHPVHVEAVGNMVGQSELHVGLATVMAMLVYLTARTRGRMSARTRLGIAGLALWAALAKEHGLLVPLSLVLAEATIVPPETKLRERLRRLIPLWILLAAVLVLVLSLRWAVLGQLHGGTPAIVLQGSTVGERVLTMLAVVPEWARLLVWPRHLVADYSPPALARATSFGASQLLGLVLMVGLAVVVWKSWTRRPVMAFGLCFMALWLLPVTNVVAPTGIVLAERTLYLPSLGFALAIGSAAVLLRHVRRPVQVAAVVGAVGLLTAGTWWSARRQAVWHDSDRLFRQTILDAPDNYRAYWLWARHLQAMGRIDQAVDALHLAADLYVLDPVVFEDLGQLQRVRGRCDWAIEPLNQALALDSTRVVARARLVECLMQIGELAAAREVAATGVALGDSAFARPLARIDSMVQGSTGPGDR